MKKDNWSHMRRWLSRYHFIIKEIGARREHLQDFIEELYNPLQATVQDGMPKGGGISDPTLKRVLDIKRLYETMMAEMQANIDSLYLTKNEIEQAVAQLDAAERCVIYHRYILGIAWADMPEYIGYERAQCYRLETSGLKKLAKMIQNEDAK